jgi:molybdenum cofactor cytidylyltransferase
VTERPRVVGLLVAAGRGRRFAAASQAHGEAKPDKLLAPIDGRPVARHALETLQATCDAVIAVVRPDACAALREALAGARIVVCAEADLGMGHSLASAARAAGDEVHDALLVLPADMPWVEVATVRTIADAARAGDAPARARRIVVPALPDGRRGHPVAFGAMHRAALERLEGDRGARGLLDTWPLEVVTVDDAGILRDVDTPSDLPPS